MKRDKGAFGRWFRPLLEVSGLKQIRVAERAGIDAVSLSRILAGEHGTTVQTAESLADSLNALTGRDIADRSVAARLAAGIESNTPESIQAIGFDGLDADDMAEIISFIEFKKAQKT